MPSDRFGAIGDAVVAQISPILTQGYARISSPTPSRGGIQRLGLDKARVAKGTPIDDVVAYVRRYSAPGARGLAIEPEPAGTFLVTFSPRRDL